MEMIKKFLCRIRMKKVLEKDPLFKVLPKDDQREMLKKACEKPQPYIKIQNDMARKCKKFKM